MKRVLKLSVLAFLLFTSCAEEDEVLYRQVERLGRPAINEAFVLSNDYLNDFNEINPALDLTATAAPIINEMTSVLTVLNTLASNLGQSPPSVANVKGGFLPDVMRIDTSLSIAVGATAYGELVNDNVSKPKILVGGRKITDDVVNITLHYIFNNSVSPTIPGGLAAIDDKVSYYHGMTGCTWPGANVGSPGHHCLTGQTSQLGAASFPFLATPN